MYVQLSGLLNARTQVKYCLMHQSGFIQLPKIFLKSYAGKSLNLV